VCVCLFFVHPCLMIVVIFLGVKETNKRRKKDVTTGTQNEPAENG